MGVQNWLTESKIITSHILQSQTDELSDLITLLETAREIINPLGPSHKKLWAEAVGTAYYIRNWIYRQICQREDVTPIEALSGIKTDMTNLRIIGRAEYVSITNQLRVRKGANNAHQGMVVGYLGGVHRVFNLETGRIFI